MTYRVDIWAARKFSVIKDQTDSKYEHGDVIKLVLAKIPMFSTNQHLLWSFIGLDQARFLSVFAATST